MAWRGSKRYLETPGPRHDAEWYDQSREDMRLDAGDRLIVPCQGGPSDSRLEAFPPRLEIPDHGGTYTLIDIGPRNDWYYLFVPTQW